MSLTELYIADINNSPRSKINLLGDNLKELNTGVFWNPQTPKPANVNSIFEIIPSAFLGNSQEIIELKAKLDIKTVDIHRWITNRLRKDSTWLYWRANKEPILKRDVIYSISWAGTGLNDAYLIDEFLQGNLTIERRGIWETIEINQTIQEDMSISGDYFIIDNHGTSNSRISLLEISTPSNITYPNAVDEYWIGIREELLGFDDFNPVLPLANGRFENGMTPNGFLNMATPDLLRRFRITVGEIIGAGNPTNFVGRYVVLLKQNSSDLNTVYLMKYGNRANNTLKTEYRRVYVQNAGNLSWVNLGEIEIPSNNNRLSAVSDIRNSEIEVWIGRTTGVGTVQLDDNPILLVPSRHFLYLNTESLSSSETTLLQFRTHEDNSTSFELRISTGEIITGVPHPRNFTIPYEGGLLVYAAQRNGIVNNADVSTLTLNYYQRYLSYANRQFNIIKSSC